MTFSGPRLLNPKAQRTLARVLVLALFTGYYLSAGPIPSSQAVACSATSISVNRVSASIMYVDTGISPQLTGSYVGYEITNTGGPIADVWVDITNFGGGVVAKAADEDGRFHAGPLGTVDPAYAYFYLVASGSTAMPQTHDIAVYSGHPDLGGSQICTSSFEIQSVEETIKAKANKVTTVVAGPNPAELGGEMTITVTGQTGQVGDGPPAHPDGAGVFVGTPATDPAWPANAYQLVDTQISFEGLPTYNDTLVVSGLNGSNRDYTAVYTFVAVGTTLAPTSVSPVNYIASGTQIKHTDTSGYAADLAPILPTENKLTLTKSASPTQLPATGGTVTYTVTISNAGNVDATLDDVIDTLPAGAGYVASSARFNGTPIPDPYVSGQTLSFVGFFTTLSGQTSSLTYDATLPGTVGSYVNSATGHIGSEPIDTTLDTSDPSPATSTVQVGDSAAPPVANDDTATTPEDTDTIIDVVNNDTDPNSNLDPASVTITGLPGDGTATPNGDGTVTYDPDDDFNGSDSFTYRVCDTTSPTPLCDTATVTVTVDAVDDPPVAADDSPSTPEDTAATFDLTGNDSDPDGNLDPTTLTILSGPSHGSVINNNDGTIDYDPTPGYSGADSLTYQVCDDTGLCDTATVTIDVTNVNEPPVANPDTVSTPEDTAVTIDVAANDTDPDGNLDPTSVNIPLGSEPSNGTAVANGDGTVTYTPDANFNGSDSFDYEICDLDGLCSVASATVTTNVVPVDDPPDAVDDTVSTPEDTPATFDLTANDTDPDGNLVPASLTILSGPSNGAVTNHNDGTVTYTPTADYEGADTLTYQVCDTTVPPLCDTATVAITVTAVDDDPVAENDSTSTDEDVAVTVDVAANDSDPDGNLVPTSVTIVTPPLLGTAVVNVDGTITYTPAVNDTGTYTIVYQICDASGPPALCDQADLVVTVNNLPDPPDAVDDPLLSTLEGTPGLFDLTGNDTDPDGDLDDSSLTILTGPSHGTVTDHNDGTITYTPTGDYEGTDSLTYQVCDSTVPPLCDSATATITVTAVDDPPVANDDAAATGEDVDVVIDVAANDTDPDADLDLTSITITVDPTSGTATPNNDGTVTYEPDPNTNGPDSFTYQICDGTPTCDTATVTVDVVPVNDLPTAVDDAESVTEDDSATWDLSANDSDVDGNLDKTTLTILSGPSNGTLVNEGDGTVTYTPDPNYTGPDSLTYQICDLSGECATASLTITVDPEPDPPVANDDAATTPEDTAVTVAVASNDTDIDGDLVPTSVSIVTGPATGTASVNPDGTITYTPAANDAGTYTITYQICDASGPPALCDQADLVVTVTAVDDPPSATDDTLTVTEDTPGTVNVSTNDSDVDGDLEPSTVTITGQGSNGTAVSNGDGTVTYTPDGDYNGPDSFTYQICDDSGLCDSATVAVTVDADPDPPVAVDDSTTVDEDASVIVDVAFNDTDPDADVNPASVSITGGPNNGAASANGDGTITYTPTADWNGADTITYEVCDLSVPTPLCDTGTLTITVNPLPDPPAVVDDLATTDEDDSVLIDVTDNDVDPDGDLDPTSVVVGTPPGHGSAAVDPVTGDITYNPDGDWNGTDSFTYQVCDLTATCSTATVTVVVSPVNDGPTPQPDTVLIWEDTPVTIDVVANDTDIDDEIDPTTVRVIEDALHGEASVDPVTGEITYTPDRDYHGPDTLSYLVCDQSGSCAITSLAVTVMPVNDEPVRVDPVVFEVTVGDNPGTTYHEDPEGDAYVVSLVAGLLPPGVELLPDGTLHGVSDVAGTYVATIEVCDIHDACSRSPLVVQVGAAAFASLPFTGLALGGLTLLGLLLLTVGSLTKRLAREE